MSEKFSYKVTVVMTDGTIREFLSLTSFSNTSEGSVLYWRDVLIDGRRCSYYSIPVRQIKEVFETELD